MSRFYISDLCLNIAVSHDSLASSSWTSFWCTPHTPWKTAESTLARVDDMLAIKIIKSVCNFCNSTMVESQNNRGDERWTINLVEAILSYAFYVWHQESNCWLPLNCPIKKLPVAYCFPTILWEYKPIAAHRTSKLLLATSMFRTKSSWYMLILLMAEISPPHDMHKSGK